MRREVPPQWVLANSVDSDAERRVSIIKGSQQMTWVAWQTCREATDACLWHILVESSFPCFCTLAFLYILIIPIKIGKV